MKKNYNNNWFKIFITVALIFFSIFAFSYFTQEKIERLDPPIIKQPKENGGANIFISGTAYPNSHVLIYINNQYGDDAFTNENGIFEKMITTKKEGINQITAKQTYKNITSGSSNIIQVNADLTAPDSTLFSINDHPETSKSKIISIYGNSESNSEVWINNSKYDVDASGHFSGSYELSEGSNNLQIRLADKYGNRTKIISEKTVAIDTTAPKLETGIFCDLYNNNENIGINEEYVCIKIDNWQGYLDIINSVPITGYIKGNIKYITIDNINITWDENNEIYQRINLMVHGGLNKYKVVVEDLDGNKASSYVELNATRNNDSIDLNINE